MGVGPARGGGASPSPSPAAAAARHDACPAVLDSRPLSLIAALQWFPPPPPHTCSHQPSLTTPAAARRAPFFGVRQAALSGPGRGLARPSSPPPPAARSVRPRRPHRAAQRKYGLSSDVMALISSDRAGSYGGAEHMGTRIAKDGKCVPRHFPFAPSATTQTPLGRGTTGCISSERAASGGRRVQWRKPPTFLGAVRTFVERAARAGTMKRAARGAVAEIAHIVPASLHPLHCARANTARCSRGSGTPPLPGWSSLASSLASIATSAAVYRLPPVPRAPSSARGSPRVSPATHTPHHSNQWTFRVGGLLSAGCRPAWGCTSTTCAGSGPPSRQELPLPPLPVLLILPPRPAAATSTACRIHRLPPPPLLLLLNSRPPTRPLGAKTCLN